jgi:hypothetical protein
MEPVYATYIPETPIDERLLLRWRASCSQCKCPVCCSESLAIGVDQQAERREDLVGW